MRRCPKQHFSTTAVVQNLSNLAARFFGTASHYCLPSCLYQAYLGACCLQSGLPGSMLHNTPGWVSQLAGPSNPMF